MNKKEIVKKLADLMEVIDKTRNQTCFLTDKDVRLKVWMLSIMSRVKDELLETGNSIDFEEMTEALRKKEKGPHNVFSAK